MEKNKEILKMLSTKYKKKDLINNLETHNNINDISLLNSDTLNKNIDKNESFRNFYLFQTKKYFDGKTYFGLVHIRAAYFVKKKERYDDYINTVINKINKAIEISDENNEIKGKFYVYLDLEGINPKNFSKKFLGKMSKIMDKLYINQMVKYFITGKKIYIHFFWPIISLFLDKVTKKKILCLE